MQKEMTYDEAMTAYEKMFGSQYPKFDKSKERLKEEVLECLDKKMDYFQMVEHKYYGLFNY